MLFSDTCKTSKVPNSGEYNLNITTTNDKQHREHKSITIDLGKHADKLVEWEQGILSVPVPQP